MAGRSISMPVGRRTVSSVAFAGRPVLALLLVLAVVVAVRPMQRPPAIPASLAPEAFSAQRAWADLEAITVAPRAMGTPGLAAARAYLVGELEALGLSPQVMDVVRVAESAEAGAATLARSHNIVARLPGTDSTGAILIAGHLDTVHTTAAAGDCGACAVGVLEAARALAAGAPLRNDVIFLIEDGEETTRVGAFAFVEQHPWAQDVRVALNQEAMGTTDASLLYVTGPENGWLMREALAALPNPVAYSFINDLVWGTGTGGSDLDQYLLAAPVGLGFAFVGNVAAYHTQADNPDTLDPATWQHQGESMVALARHFGNLPLDGPLTAPNLVYFNLFAHLVVRYAPVVGMALALLVALGYGAVVWVGLWRRLVAGRGLLVGFGLLLPWVIAATALSAVIWFGLRMLDPRLQVFMIGITYDRPWYTVAFVLLTMGVVTGGYAWIKRWSPLELGLGALAWWVLPALWLAWAVPGTAPVFTLPALCMLLPYAVWLSTQSAAHGANSGASGRTPQSISGWSYPAALAVAAIISLFIVVPMLSFLGTFSGRAELLMNLPMIALLPAPLAGLLAGLFLPVWGYLNGARRGLVSGGLLGAAVVILVVIGLTAEFTPARPKPNMVAYVQDPQEQGAPYWVTLGANVGGRRAGLLDEWTGQFFADGAEASTFDPWGSGFMRVDYPAYRAPAPPVDLPAPRLEPLADRVDAQGQRHLQLHLSSPSAAPVRLLKIEAADGIVTAALQGEPLTELTTPIPETGLRRVIWVMVQGMSGEPIQLELALQRDGAVSMMVEERTLALPTPAGMTIAPRPAWMMPSPTFVTDMTIARYHYTVE